MLSLPLTREWKADKRPAFSVIGRERESEEEQRQRSEKEEIPYGGANTHHQMNPLNMEWRAGESESVE